ncbi:MAG: tRNA pseudouridine(55) synthase TruB [Bdellovibrionales bacterium]
MSWNGLLLVDKPPGCTSHDVVDRVRRIFDMSAVGHSGTLDPLASGLMVVLLGHATKLSDYILGQDKRYRVTMKFGWTTDSGDRDGQTVREEPFMLPHEQVERMALQMSGDMELPVPVFSATRVKGKKLYEYARAEKEVTVPVKAMRFYNISSPNWVEEQLEIEVSCAKGGYIRSWVTALGAKVGVGATVMELRRLVSAPYNVHEAISLEALAEIVACPEAKANLGPAFIGMAQALPGWQQCVVKGREEQLLRNGQISHDLTNRLVVAQKQAHMSQTPVGIKVLGTDGELVGLIEASIAQGLKIRRIFAQS